MLAAHHAAFVAAARETNRTIVLRNVNPLADPWILKGYPPKPMAIKAKSSEKNGLVQCLDRYTKLVIEDLVRAARAAGFFVVDKDLKARDVSGREQPLPRASEWPLEAHQVIDPIDRLPLVSDYDLCGVIDPAAPTRNLVLAASKGYILDDWSNPDIRRVAAAINAKLDRPRVLHGGHEGFSEGGADLADAGGCTVFCCDGSVKPLETGAQVAEFYAELGRKGVNGSFRGANPPAGPFPAGPPTLSIVR